MPRIAINGLGRIGQVVLMDSDDLELVAVADEARDDEVERV